MTITNLTPYEFSKKYVKFDSQDWIVCGNYPHKKYPFYRKYNIEYCSNMSKGVETEIVNLPIEHLLELSKLSIDDNQSIWFASDFSHYHQARLGVLNTKIYDYSMLQTFDIDKSYKKDKFLEYKISIPNHAMLIVGYNKINEKIDKWLVENSHGIPKDKDRLKDNSLNNKGYLTMTNEWFNRYVYQVVIKKKYLTNNILRRISETEPIVLKPWSMIGCEVL